MLMEFGLVFGSFLDLDYDLTQTVTVTSGLSLMSGWGRLDK